MNLTVNFNEVVCVLGHNGAGKTTLINLLTGMLEPSSGDAVVFGSSLIQDVNTVRKDIGLCQ